MRTSRLVVSFGLAVLVSLVAMRAKAQDPDPNLGMRPADTYQFSSIDTVSESNASLSVDIPLISYPQRGGKLKLNFALHYVNLGAYSSQICILGKCQWTVLPRFGGFEIIDRDNLTPTGKTYVDRQTPYAVWSILEPNRSSHLMGDLGSGTELETLDATAFHYEPATSTITTPNGIHVQSCTGQSGASIGCESPLREDPNGNKITFSSTSGWTDTIERKIPVPATTTDYSGCTGTKATILAQVWNLPGPSGGIYSVKFCYADIPTTYGPGLPGSFTGGAEQIQSVVLPNKTTWTFEYTAAGDLGTITFPTGGTVSYTWGPNGYCTSQQVYTYNPSIATRTFNANDGTGNHVWKYNYTCKPTVSATLIVTDPLNNDSVYTSSAFGGGIDTVDFYVTQSQIYQGSHSSGALLKTVKTDYSGSVVTPGAPDGLSSIAIDLVPIRTTTIWPNGQQSKIEHDYDSGHTFTQPDPLITGNFPLTYGREVAERDYDYGSGAPGSLLRATQTNYEAFVSSTYLTNNMLTLPSSVEITDGSGGQAALTTYGYDESSLVSSGISTQHDSAPWTGNNRGNQTSIHRWLNGSTVSHTTCPISVSNGNLTSTNIFYDTGTINKSTDFCGSSHTTTFAYSSTFAGAYVTQKTNALGQTIAHNYDFNTGVVTSITDYNNQTTTFTYDGMVRLAGVKYPDGGFAGITRQETTFPFTATLTKKMTVSQNYVDTDVYDGLGRLSQDQLTSDQPSGTDYTDTTYDAVGRVASVSNPYRSKSDSTYGITQYAYDTLNRETVQTQQDGSTLTWQYTGSAVLAADEGNGITRISRVSQDDALGRLLSVCEVSSTSYAGGGTPAACGQQIARTGYLTSYTYDALNNLLTATQGSLATREFVYNSLSELTSDTNPESGTTTYGYDAAGNLFLRTRPAPNQTNSAVTATTTHAYDVLNRPTSVTYTDPANPATPSTYFDYDSVSNAVIQDTGANKGLNLIGRKVDAYVKNSSGTIIAGEAYSYDQMGRIWDNPQCSPDNCATGTYAVDYTYYLNGETLTSSNGLGNVFTYGVNGADEIISVTSNWNDSQHPPALLSAAQYSPLGGITSASYGNGAAEALSYNNRGRVIGDIVSGFTSTGAPTTLYSFNITDYAPDGDMLAATDSVNGTWAYTYDDLNHLATATLNPGSNPAELAWTYDRYGNRWTQKILSGSEAWPQPSVSFTGGNNRIDQYQYDATGNVTYDGVHHYTYDDEGRVIAVDSGGTATYVYDADGLRVHRVGSEGPEDYTYDLAGHAVATIFPNGSPQRREVYAGSRHVATYYDVTTFFDHTDWIGTERVRSAVNGTSFETCSSLPYGDDLLCQGGNPSPLHFTGKMRDSESGNDYFNARYLGSSMGRFLTPDPTGGHKEDPQSLNKYSYVLNNPLTLTDPTGLNPAPDQTCAVNTAVCYVSGSNIDETGGTFSAATPIFGTTNFAAWYATLPPQPQVQNTVTVEQVQGQGANFFDHAAINVNGQQPVGLEQKKDSAAKALEGKTTPGSVKAVDPNRKVEDKAVIQVTPEQAVKIQTFLSNAKQNPPNYNLYHSNCAQFCESALKAGGVKNVPNDVTPHGLVQGLKGSPSFVDYLRMIPLPPPIF